MTLETKLQLVELLNSLSLDIANYEHDISGMYSSLDRLRYDIKMAKIERARKANLIRVIIGNEEANLKEELAEDVVEKYIRIAECYAGDLCDEH